MPSDAINDRLRKPWAMVPPNGAPSGTFLARTICVNVDPLSISSACRELVDHGLVDGHPIRSAEILAYEIPDRCECDRCHRWCPLFRLLNTGHIPRCCEEGYDNFVEWGPQY
ncbi:hypothetical protein ACVWXO_009389 [Bradyrhizobium sp. LM2.7]